jgi:hypothetical protein
MEKARRRAAYWRNHEAELAKMKARYQARKAAVAC